LSSRDCIAFFYGFFFGGGEVRGQGRYLLGLLVELATDLYEFQRTSQVRKDMFQTKVVEKNETCFMVLGVIKHR
jgi:hypothetical protein